MPLVIFNPIIQQPVVRTYAEMLRPGLKLVGVMSRKLRTYFVYVHWTVLLPDNVVPVAASVTSAVTRMARYRRLDHVLTSVVFDGIMATSSATVTTTSAFPSTSCNQINDGILKHERLSNESDRRVLNNWLLPLSNNLPLDTRLSLTTDNFKHHLKSHPSSYSAAKHT